MKSDDVQKFEKMYAQLTGIHQELAVLTKKSPNDAVNKFKLKLVNDVLIECNDILGERYKPFTNFQIFAEDEMPTNSDVTFIISQYIECAENFRADNIEIRRGIWCWNTDDGIDIRARAPRKISRD